MKKDKWWGYLILLPMIALTASSFLTYFSEFQFSMPRYILIVLFCACAMILYPVAIFRNKKIRVVGASIGAAAVVILTVFGLLHPPVYSTNFMGSNEEHTFDDSYTVYLTDKSYGDVSIRYEEAVDDYFIHVDFKRAGDTVLTMVSPTGEKTEYELHIERDTYEVKKKSQEEASK